MRRDPGCIVRGCRRHHHARRLCRFHYQRARSYLPLTEQTFRLFRLHAGDYITHWCVTCHRGFRGGWPIPGHQRHVVIRLGPDASIL